jgi:hypothetical protein
MIKRTHRSLLFQPPRTEAGVAHIAEFGAALSLGAPLIIFVVFALRLGSAIFLAQNATSQAVRLAGESFSYDQALRRCAEQISIRSNCGLTEFAQLRPYAGQANTGVDLFVTIQDKSSLVTSIYGPNKSLPAAIDRQNKIYKYLLVSHFQFGSLLQGDVHKPLAVTYLTEPIRINFSAVCSAEHPESVAIGLTPSIDQKL